MNVLIQELWEAFRYRSILYLSIGGTLSLLIYFLFDKKNYIYKIKNLPHQIRHVKREIKYSLLSIFIFSILAMVLYRVINSEYSNLYQNIEQYGTPYFILSILVTLFIHDAYFYFTHRILHTKWLMRKVHYIHHQSNDPTLWAAFSFHPIEAIINFGIFFLLIITIPIHKSVFTFFFILNNLNNIIGHCGFEIFPKNFTRHWLSKWITTSTHHHLHHSRGKYNYGLYFTWLDILFKTNNPNYESVYDKVIQKRKSSL